jgi:hypothetical protein
MLLLLSQALQDFEACCVMQTCQCQMPSTHLQIRTLIAVIPALRMKNFLTDQMQPPGSAPVAEDQYLLECVALADRNFNVACETGIRYPSLVAMLNRRSMLWRATVILHVVHVHNNLY